MNGITAAAQAARAGQVLKLEAEVVVVGLGAGGSMALHDLALAGVSVLGVELGDWFEPEEMELREERMLPRLFAEAGARATDDFGITVLQGRGVGGSTLHNTNLCRRLPREIVEEWEEEHGLAGLGGADLDADFAAVEAMLGVAPVPDARVNAANRAVQAGMEALGYKGGRMSHNRDGDCRASGFCEVGCPNNGKAHAAKVLVPPALRAGARILTEARVDRVLFRNGAVYGVSGYAVCAQTRMDVAPFVILAKRVIMGASATGSAAVLLRSGVPDPRRLMGSNLHLHPGAVVAGVFDKEGQDPIRAWEGVPQSVECTEFLEFGRGARRRAWLVPGFAHPGGAALFVPGFGAQHAALMRLFPRLAVMIVMLHDHSRGRVSPGEGERVHLRYKLDDEDREQLALGMREAGKILLAGGASRVMVPTSPPLWARTEGELSRLQARDLGPLNPALTAVHPMSTLWMGADPVRSVVDARGEHHHLRGLYVADGSLFPTSIGGPPQIPIYTFGRRVGRAVLGSLR